MAKRRSYFRKPKREEAPAWLGELPPDGYSRWVNNTPRSIDYENAYWPPTHELSIPNCDAQRVLELGATFLRVNT